MVKKATKSTTKIAQPLAKIVPTAVELIVSQPLEHRADVDHKTGQAKIDVLNAKFSRMLAAADRQTRKEIHDAESARDTAVTALVVAREASCKSRTDAECERLRKALSRGLLASADEADVTVGAVFTGFVNEDVNMQVCIDGRGGACSMCFSATVLLKTPASIKKLIAAVAATAAPIALAKKRAIAILKAKSNREETELEFRGAVSGDYLARLGSEQEFLNGAQTYLDGVLQLPSK